MTRQYQVSESIRSNRLIILFGLYFLSGLTGLIFQVVWMYRLGLVFGNAAYATAATLAAFFLGIALGGWFWGNASARLSRPLTAYGLMEVGIALTALLWIPGIEFYKTHYSSLVAMLDSNQSMLTVMKFAFSTTLLLLPTVLMGGTFPMLAQYVGKKRHKLASRGTLLYAVNTVGASLGAFMAGFFLLSSFGVHSTYAFAVSMAIIIGILAILLDRVPIRKKPEEDISAKIENTGYQERLNKHQQSFTLSLPQFILIAFASGYLALSIETIWTRMFAQVLQNSVYSFAAILVVFLIALGIGGFLSHILVRLNVATVPALLMLLSASAILVGFSPVVFNASTNGLNYLASSATWLSYLTSVFGLSFIVVFLPTAVLGAIFPFLLKAAPSMNQEPGRFVGKLVLYNALGGTIGPVIAGFVLLDAVGLWNSVKIVAILYAVVALLIATSFYDKKKLRWLVFPVIGILGVVALTNPPIVRLATGEKILDMWQSSDGVVSIVESGDNIQMRLDNYYVLGDSRSVLVEQMQAHIPLLIHPSPGRTLFLGMGTGITAGAALNHRVEEVVVVELVSNVVIAAQRYFSSLTNGLFDDKRVEIVTDDARNYLLGTEKHFDVIVGDLFTPWHAGTGSLYTVEHFQQAKNRLASGGLFAQWLPLYQLTTESFETITATFAAVFPQVTLWRADFSGSGASIVLVGQDTGAKLDQETLQRNIRNIVGEQDNSTTLPANHMAGLFYLGNYEALRSQKASIRLNTDDKRSVEFQAPVLSQQVHAGLKTFIVGNELATLFSTLATALPAEQDPYLSELPPDEIRYVKVGLHYFNYLQLVAAGKESEADLVLGQIRSLDPEFLMQQDDPSKDNEQ
jgi:spermidine synthase